MKELNELLSEFVFNLKYNDIGENSINEIKKYIIDYYSACFAGKKINAEFNDAIHAVLQESENSGNCSVFLSDHKQSVMTAAFLNAMYSHGADMDDGNKKAMGHVGCHTVSTAFAVGEELGSSGKDIITAITVGYELYNRLAAAVQPGLVNRGFHSTGTAGGIACAGVAAKLYGLNTEQIYNAISFAAVQASGLMIISESGQSCKPVNPANAARIGVFSAKCAQKGITAPSNIFESNKGWFHAMSDAVDYSCVLDGLGENFTVNECYIKPYSSCRHTHCGIECALNIRTMILNDGFSVDEIERVEIFIYKNAINVAGQVVVPQSEEDAKFSIHYSLAYSLLYGHFKLEDLKRFDDIKTADLIKKIIITEDPSMENVKAGIRGSRVDVYLKNGKKYTDEVLSPKGESNNPMTEDDVKDKLSECVNGLYDGFNINEFIERINKFDQINKFMGINSLIVD